MAYPSTTGQGTKAAPQPGSQTKQRSRSGLGSFITFLIVLILVAGGVFALLRFNGFGGSVLTLQADWQAVFLSNGQVYFGKLTDMDDRNVHLNDIYYLQVVNQPLQRSATGEEPIDPSQTEQRLTLIKLGNEIHGPFDAMVINRDHVVIIEDLRDDSRVVQAIKDYAGTQASQ